MVRPHCRLWRRRVAAGRAGQPLSWLREEVDALFPRQDLTASPPRFLGKEEYCPWPGLWRKCRKFLPLGNLVRCYDRGLAAVESCLPAARKEEQGYLLALRDEMQRCRAAAGLLADALENLAQRAEKIVAETDFSALYNRERDLFSIGYSVDEEKLLDSYYDLPGFRGAHCQLSGCSLPVGSRQALA